MEKKVHILVVSQYFYPEQFRINDICVEWVKRGYKITVLTGIPNYPQGKYYEGYDLYRKRTEVWNGIKIIRVPIVARGNNSLKLASNYVSFVASGLVWEILTTINADFVFNYEVSPMTQALVGVWYAKRKNIPCYLYVTDLWPDNVEIVTGIHNVKILGAINAMVNYIYKHSTMIFTSSESFIEKMIERGVPREKIQFWPQYAEDFYIPYRTKCAEALSEETTIPNDGQFNLVFAGNIGYAQGLDILIKAAECLKYRGEYVRFNIVGDGRYKIQMRSEVSNANVQEYFNFIERQPAESIPKYMAAGDAAIICLSKSDVFAMTIPAKTQSCLACGMPILVSADGEIRSIINNAKCGYTSAAGDVIGLAENIIRISRLTKDQLKALGYNAISYYQKHFDKEMLLEEIDKYLKGSR